MTGEAGIATTGDSLGCFGYFKKKIGITLEIEDSLSHLAALTSSHLGYGSRRNCPM